MVIRFNCLMVRNDLGKVRLKEIRRKICVEYITLKQSHVIKIICALVVRVVKWKYEVPGAIKKIKNCNAISDI
jgi:hypothetical protein